MTLVKLSYKLFLREFKSGQLLLMFLSLTLAVGIVASISLFTDRLDKSLLAESKEFLGGDLKYESSSPLDENKLPELEFESVKTYLFGTMLSTKDNFQLASVKSTEAPYPLVSEIEIFNGKIASKLKSPPKPNEIWLDQRLVNLLEIEIGSSINVGETNLTFSGIIYSEPDRGAGSFAFAPTAIMNSANLEKSGVIKPGSRVRYSYLFKGNQNVINRIENFLQSIKKPGDEIILPKNDSNALGQAISRASNFFLLGSLLAVILSSLAISICSLQFTRRHISYVAIFKALGLSPNEVKKIYLLIFFLITFFSASTGIVFGWIVQLSFTNLLSEYFPTDLPYPGISPYWISVLTALVCLIGFAYPMLRNLFKVSPNQILRRTALASTSLGTSFYVFSGLAAFYVLLIYYIQDFEMTNIIYFSILSFALLIFSLVYSLFSFIKPLGLNPLKPFKMLAFELSRRKLFNSLQIISLTIAIALSLITYSISTNILSAWEASIPKNAPNNFIFNIDLNDKNELIEFFSENKIVLEKIYPVTSARFFRKFEGKVIDRTFNFTWMKNLPDGNEIIEGEWFKNKDYGISISSEIAERYDLNLSDEIIVDIAGRRIETFIQSIRNVNWENFSPNFFAIGYPKDFENISSTFITSFHVPDEKKFFTSKLMKSFPTISLISLEALISEIQEIINKVSQALKLILGLTLMSALFLILATIQESFKQREKQNAILKTLGLSKEIMQKNTFLEYLTLGIVSGVLGSFLALIANYFIESIIFEIQPRIYWDIIFVGTTSSILVIGLLSALFTYLLTLATPKDVLRGS